MKALRITESAKQDFYRERDRLDQLNLQASLPWEDDILSALDQIAAFPDSAPIRSELAEAPLHVLTRKSHLIVYDPTADPIDIIAILHGAQDVQATLKGRRASHP